MPVTLVPDVEVLREELPKTTGWTRNAWGMVYNIEWDCTEEKGLVHVGYVQGPMEAQYGDLWYNNKAKAFEYHSCGAHYRFPRGVAGFKTGKPTAIVDDIDMRALEELFGPL
eukprot:TRINITY_DN26910_c0_g1_i1.p2 TRINITY_DN26910_c0_g1~~TRINITY_DN26910_c0_g1_i1.p2  ORF type:complete len:112 (+),score=17.32 TRINITY_DN26910_c0_g1_i1:76-411(+)